MNKRFSTIGYILILLCMVSGTIFAQAVKIGGEIRTRTEYRDGFQAPIGSSDSAATVTNIRTRINMSYTTNVLKAKITIQDSRTAGQTDPGTTASGTTGIYEAWGEYLFAPGISAAVGRQPLEYDDKRIFSASNWSNTGNAHDALVVKYTSTDFSAHIGSAWNNVKDENTQKSEIAYNSKAYYKNLTYLWLTKSFRDLGFSALWVNEGLQKKTVTTSGTTTTTIPSPDNNYRNTVGGNLWYNNLNFPVNAYLTGYYQFGHQTTTKGINQGIDAYMLAGKIQGKINSMFNLTVGEDYYSGSGTTIASNQTNTFNKLYGANHSFNGFMEYWKTPKAQGLSDLYFNLGIKATEKLNGEVAFHKFDYANKPKKGNKDLGSELDVTINYTVSPEIALQGGYSTYFLTDAVKLAKSTSTYKTFDDKTQQWAYVMVTFKPAFLNVK